MPTQPTVNIEALSDLCTPWCIHVVATLKIADHISCGVQEIGHLASVAECDADCLARVLRHLAGKGVFLEPTPGIFALNDAARQLLEPGLRLWLDLNGIGGRVAHAWGTLLKNVQTGYPAYHEVFGRPFWEDLDAHSEVAESFDALMGPAGHGVPDPNILLDGDWKSIRTVVDVGGGTGSMLAEILRAQPHIKGTLVDFPKTVARAANIFQAAGIAGRANAIGQSFFDPLPPGADLYLLMKVLNDWPDRETRLILARCAEAARPSGRVIICGGVAPDGFSQEVTPEMVLLGGRTNTLTEFRRIARDTGLEVVAAQAQPSGRFLVECRPT